jgi:cytolysin-activating lysine-acyltransferase
MISTDIPSSELQILIPFFNGHPFNHQEALGLITWLWIHSPLHQEWPSALMSINVLPAVAHRQFLIIRNKNGLPILYTSWAYFDEERERQYLQNTNSISINDWNCGDRMWFIDWIAPHGGSRSFIDKLRREFFPNGAAFALRVKKNITKGVIQDHFGVNLNETQKKIFKERLQKNLERINKAQLF